MADITSENVSNSIYYYSSSELENFLALELKILNNILIIQMRIYEILSGEKFPKNSDDVFIKGFGNDSSAVSN